MCSPGLDVIKLEFILRLKIKRNDWLLADTCVSAISQSLRFILSLRMNSCFISSRPGPKVIKLFSYSTQLSTKFIMLINVKITTIFGILTFISMINTLSERYTARNVLICQYFSFYEQLKFRAQLS